MTSHRLAQSSHLHGSASSAYSYPSKPHVLAGVQDAYWSDEEVDDNTCPLCIKELDLEERSFKPCLCGYQICLFCWHHIRQNLNGLCPACRREYTEEAVVWKAVAVEDNRRIAQQKKKKEKERKDLETLGRKQYLDVRIVQRNVVYVTGVGRKYAKEEMIPILRSNDYFGQYGKISKILLRKRTPTGSSEPIVGIYITYQRREDAARAIEKIDGSASPSGDGEVMHASFGTAKYCINYLRSVSCTNSGCLDVHEWGDDRDCFTRQDLVSIKHLNKETEKRTTTSATIVRKSDEAPTLPRTASWATRTQHVATSQTAASGGAAPAGSSGQTIQLGPPGPVMRSGRQPRTRQNTRANTSAESNGRGKDRKLQTIPAPSASRPSTPSDKASKSASVSTVVPAGPAADTTSNVSSPQATPSAISSEDSASIPPTVSIPPPPGLSLPPGLSIPSKPEETPAQPPPGLSRPPGLAPPPADISSPIPTRGYQPSSQARALMEDTLARREAAVATPPLVFPDFDRTLANLALNTGFNFSFATLQVSDSPASSQATSRKGSMFDPFASPVDTLSPVSSRTPKNTFDPFGDAGAGSGYDIGDGSRMASRFDFARRPGSLGSGRESSVFNLGSRQQNLAHPEAPSTLYSSDVSARSQQSWYQSTPQADYRSPAANGIPSLTSLHSSVLHQPFESTSYNEVPTTPFQPFDMPESMQDLVRGFETPSLETSASQLEQQQAQAAYTIQHQRAQQYDPFQPQSVPPSPAVLQDAYAAPRMQMMNTQMSSSQPPRMARQDSSVARAGEANFPYTHSQTANNQQGAGAVNSNIHVAAPRGLTSSPADGNVLPPISALALTQQQLYLPPNLNILVPPFATARFRSETLGGVMQTPSSHFASPATLNSLGPAISPLLDGGPTPVPVNSQQPPPFVSNSAVVPLSVAHTPTSIRSSIAPSVSASATGFHTIASVGTGTTHSNSPPPNEALDEEFPALPSTSTASLVHGNAPISSAISEVTFTPPGSVSTAPPAPVKPPPPAPVLVPKKPPQPPQLSGKKEKEKPKPALPAIVTNLKGKAKSIPIASTSTTPIKETEAEGKEEKAKKKEEAPKEKEKAKETKKSSNKTSSSKHETAPTSKVGAKAASKATPTPTPTSGPVTKRKEVSSPAPPPIEEHAPIMARQTRKAKASQTSKPRKQQPQTQNLRDDTTRESTPEPSSLVPEIAQPLVPSHPPIAINNAGVDELLAQLYDLPELKWMSFFGGGPGLHPRSKLELSSLVEALSALSGTAHAWGMSNGHYKDGGSTNNSHSTTPIDNAVISFQQLLETLTHTISDLLHLLPRTTWNEGVNFDGIIQDMLKSDLLDEFGPRDEEEEEEGEGEGEGEVEEQAEGDEVSNAENFAEGIDRRAQWMQLQYPLVRKLEELHHDINVASTRAVLAFNDRGWDAQGFFPRLENTVATYDKRGVLELEKENAKGEKEIRHKTIAEVESDLVQANKQVLSLTEDLRKVMALNHKLLPLR